MHLIRLALKKQKKYIFLAWLLGVILTFSNLFLPLIEANIIDTLLYTRNVMVFRNFILLWLGISFVQIGLRYFLTKIENVKITKYILEFNQELLDYLFRVESRAILAYDAAYLHARLIQDTEKILSFYYKVISGIINNVLILLFSIIVLFTVHKLLPLLIVVFLPIYFIIFVLFKEKIKQRSLELMEATNSCYAERNSIYENYLVIKTRESLPSAKNFLQEKETALLASINNMFKLRFSLSFTQVTASFLFQFAVFVFGGIAVINKSITIGVFTFLLQYFVMLLKTVEDFLDFASEYQEYQASLDRFKELFNIHTEPTGTIELAKIDSISMHDINYQFGETDEKLYKYALNLNFKAGCVYSLIGENGTGKSTALLLLLGLYRDEKLQGQVEFNNISAESINLIALRKNSISIMLQNIFKFAGSVQDYINSLLSQDEFTAACEKTAYQKVFFADNFDLRKIFTKNYDVISAGERQLLNLFVCLAKQASVYIFDEPLSNVFQSLRTNIYTLISDLAKQDKIVIIITYDNDMLGNSIVYRFNK